MQISIQNFKLLNFYKLVFNFVFRGQTTSKTLALIFTSHNKQRSPKLKSYKIFFLICMSLQLKRILHNEDLVIVLRLKKCLMERIEGITSTQRHRRNSVQEKVMFVAYSLQSGSSGSSISRQYVLHPVCWVNGKD